MHWFTHTKIDAPDARSLCWQGDRLIDWVGGAAVYFLDGSSQRAKVRYAYRFDAAVMSPSGNFAVIYERCGTKGLVLQNGKVVREVNRSFYQANAYQYPVVLFQLSNGREVLAHCPEHYNQLELEDVQTGERLTKSDVRKPHDYFHSRLAVSPGSKWLLSAGWVWHPWNTVAVYDVDEALRDPRTLDGFGREPRQSRYVCAAEIMATAFLDDTRLLLSTSADEVDVDEDEEPTECLQPNRLMLWDFVRQTATTVGPLDQPAGTVMPLGTSHAVGFFDHPKLYDLRTGRTLHAWTEIDSGKAHGSIVWDAYIPPLALDPAHNRFAVLSEKLVHVIAIDVAGLTAPP
jgi:hypothetical protein